MNHTHKLDVPAILFTLFAALLPTGCSCLRTADVETDHPQARAQIEQRLQEVFTAADSKDFERLDSYHLYGPKFTKFTTSSPARLDAAIARQGEHVGLGAVTGMKMRADVLKIDVFGKTAIATFILNYSFDMGGQRTNKLDRTTMVFVQDHGEWKIAHEHLSLIAK